MAAKQTTKPGLFLTGPDTGVGKTFVGALIARALVEQGCRVGVYKPAASGCRWAERRLVSDDAVALWEAAGRPGELDRVCPQCFEAPLAPHLAAQEVGRAIDAALLRDGINYWTERSDIVLVEGAGGLMSPLADDEYVAHLAEHFGYPLVIVAANRLGAINQVLMTLIAAAAWGDGLHVAGIVLNDVSPPDDGDLSRETNAQEIAARALSPLLTSVSWSAREFNPPAEWRRLAEGDRAEG